MFNAVIGRMPVLFFSDTGSGIVFLRRDTELRGSAGPLHTARCFGLFPGREVLWRKLAGSPVRQANGSRFDLLRAGRGAVCRQSSVGRRRGRRDAGAPDVDLCGSFGGKNYWGGSCCCVDCSGLQKTTTGLPGRRSFCPDFCLVQPIWLISPIPAFWRCFSAYTLPQSVCCFPGLTGKQGTCGAGLSGIFY